MKKKILRKLKEIEVRLFMIERKMPPAKVVTVTKFKTLPEIDAEQPEAAADWLEEIIRKHIERKETEE